MTGVDLAGFARGRYHSRSEALAVAFTETGHRSIRALVEHELSARCIQSISALRGQRGDLALVKRSGRDHSLGIVSLNGKTLLIAMGRGIGELPLTMAVKAWRV